MNSLRTGKTSSCGCYNLEKLSQRATHGEGRKGKATDEYKVWAGMMRRCYNKNEKCYERYGGRGISVDESWHDYKNFIRDMGRRPSKDHSIDRLKNELGYSKDNCAWRSRKEQCNNRSNNRWVTINGETKTVSQWAESVGIDPRCIFNRLKNGWNEERAILTPVIRKTK